MGGVSLNSRLLRNASVILGALTAGLVGLGGTASAGSGLTPASHHPIYMPTVEQRMAIQQGKGRSIQPPPIPACIPSPVPAPPPPVPSCAFPAPPYGEPWVTNMAYFGGPVQTNPHIYLVYWGWGQPGAFTSCLSAAQLRALKDPVPCDPDLAGLRMLQFVQQLGGTKWAGVQDQYYQTINGYEEHVNNPVNQLGGVWIDNTNHTHSRLSYNEIALEAERGLVHFKIPAAEWNNSNIVVVQPQHFQDGSATGYCAWHDYGVKEYYPVKHQGFPFTNMPYIGNMGGSCGANILNSSAAGALDGYSIVLGHEIEETVTDPGAGDVLGGKNYGGWLDLTGYENGDKCAWVGHNATGAGPKMFPNFPGEAAVIAGNQGGQFPVQSLWSNRAAMGAGYCEGAGTDLPANPVPPL